MTKILFMTTLLSLFAFTGCNRGSDQSVQGTGSNDQSIQRGEEMRQDDLKQGTMNDQGREEMREEEVDEETSIAE